MTEVAVLSGCWLLNKPAFLLPNSGLPSYWLMGGRQLNLSSVTVMTETWPAQPKIFAL